MKKICVTALILIICIYFTACSQENMDPGGNKNQNENSSGEILKETSEATTEIERPEIPGGTNYGGYEFNISVPEPEIIDLIRAIYIEQQNGDTMDDAVYKRNRLIEDMLNIKITPVIGSGHWLTDHSAALKKTIQAGEDAFDAIDGAYQPMLAFNGCLINLYNVPNMNLSKPWWDQRMIDDLSYTNSKLYYIIGDMGYFGMSGVMCMLFNKQLFENNGFEYPYEKVRQGKWTLGEFSKLVKESSRDLNGDGIMDESDCWGYSGNSGEVLWSMLGCGEKAIGFDEEGTPSVNSMSERHIQVISALSGLMSDKNYVLLVENMKSSDPYGAIDAARRESRLLFFKTTVAGISSMRTLEYDFGVVPQPKFDENQPEYRSPATSYSSGSSAVSIPVTNSDLERTGMILEAMSGYSTDIIIPALIDVALKSKYTRDEESSEMIELILKTKMFDPLMEYGWGRLSFGGLYWDIYSNLTLKGAENFVSAIEKQLSKTEKDRENFIKVFDEMN